MKKFYKEITEFPLGIKKEGIAEIVSATTFYDIDTFEYSLLIIAKNIGEKEVESLRIRLNLFLDITAFPYKKLDLVIPFKKGEGSLRVPLPESYFKTFEIILDEVIFKDGEALFLGISSKKKKKKAEKPAPITIPRDTHIPLSPEKRIQKAEFLKKRDDKGVDERKERIIEDEMKKVEIREKRKDRLKKEALPRIVLYFIIGYLIWFLLRFLEVVFHG